MNAFSAQVSVKTVSDWKLLVVQNCLSPYAMEILSTALFMAKYDGCYNLTDFPQLSEGQYEVARDLATKIKPVLQGHFKDSASF